MSVFDEFRRRNVYKVAVAYAVVGWLVVQIATAVRLPGFLSHGRLKLLPWWDPLSGDPRFEQIVASLAPKDGAEGR